MNGCTPQESSGQSTDTIPTLLKEDSHRLDFHHDVNRATPASRRQSPSPYNSGDTSLQIPSAHSRARVSGLGSHASHSGNMPSNHCSMALISSAL